jgi:ketosteroid isomerase-like protein
VSDAKTEIWEAIRASNARWVGGEPAGVGPLFHEDVMMASTHGQPIMQGRDAMIRSFEEYCARATTNEFDELDHAVHVFGDTAIVSYRFRVCYEVEGTHRDETGRELLVFTRTSEGWRAVWRMQLPAAMPPPARPRQGPESS